MKALITDVAGERLTAEERDFLRRENPYGIILFARNCISPPQVKTLIDEVKDALKRERTAILIDQEGGRIQRMKPPHWRAYPSAAALAAEGEDAVYQSARAMAEELHAVGVTVDCAPVADAPTPDAHRVIGDRAYGTTPEAVAKFAGACAKGLMESHIIPVVKHMPGHGRAAADSHETLPVVDASLETLRRTDFAAFRALSHLPMGMTAHVVYTAIDPDRAASVSPKVVEEIRKEIGFDGLLMSDAIDMKAMKGDMAERARAVLAAGCDVALHCNGSFRERQEVAAACAIMTDKALARSERAFAMAGL